MSGEELMAQLAPFAQACANASNEGSAYAVAYTNLLDAALTADHHDLAGAAARLAIKAARAGTTKSPASLSVGERPTPDSVLDSMAQITARLNNGSMSAADAKARLYAHQIALSAMRTIDVAEARRRKEARIRRKIRQDSQKTSSPKPPAPARSRSAASSTRSPRPTSRKKASPKRRKKNSTADSRRRSGIAQS
jgi:hypothetical protein